MGVNGDIPVFGKLAGGADVIEVAVGEDNGDWRRGEMLFRPVANEGGGPGKTGVDEGPGVVGVADSKDVDEGDAQAFNAFGDVLNGDSGVLGNFDLRHAICSWRDWDLKRISAIRLRLQCV
jgi:hypothetical protein